MGQPCQPRASVSPRDHPGVLGGPPMSPAKPAWAFSSEVCNSQMLTLQKKLCAERQNIQQGLGGGLAQGLCTQMVEGFGLRTQDRAHTGVCNSPHNPYGVTMLSDPQSSHQIARFNPLQLFGCCPRQGGGCSRSPRGDGRPFSCRFQVRAAPKTKHHGIDPIQRLAHGHAQLPQK